MAAGSTEHIAAGMQRRLLPAAAGSLPRARNSTHDVLWVGLMGTSFMVRRSHCRSRPREGAA